MHAYDETWEYSSKVFAGYPNGVLPQIGVQHVIQLGVTSFSCTTYQQYCFFGLPDVPSGFMHRLRDDATLTLTGRGKFRRPQRRAISFRLVICCPKPQKS